MGNIIDKIIFNANQSVNNEFGLRSPSPNEVLRKAIFINGPALPKISSVFSEYSLGAAYMNGNYSSVYQATQDLTLGIWDQFPNSPLSWLKDFIGTKDFVLGYYAFRSASLFDTISRIIDLKKDYKAAIYSDAIEDSRGSLIGRASIGANTAFTSAEISFEAYRPIAIIQGFTDVSSSSLLGRIGNGLVVLNLIFNSLSFTFLSSIFGIKLYEGIKMKKKLDKAEDLLGQIKILQKKLEVRPSRVQEKLIEKYGAEKARDMLIEEAFASGKAGLKSIIKELGIKNIPTKAFTDIIKQVVASGCNGGTQKDIEAQTFEKLMQIGLQMKVEKGQIKKGSKLHRWLGKTGFEAVKELSSLSGRVKLGEKEAVKQAEELVKVIKLSNTKKITENALMLSIFTFGIIAMVAAIVFTAGIPLIVVSAMVIVFNILMVGIDGFNLFESFKEERPARHDKKMLVISSLLSIASLLTLIVLGVSGVVTMGPFPIIIGTILTLLWIGQNGGTWKVMNRNERKYHEKNPTLESFLKVLEDEKQKGMIMKIFANFPEELKAKIQDELKNHQNNMRLSTLAVIEKVEQAKKKQMELLRLSLNSNIVSENPG